MSRDIQVSASILCADFSHLSDELKRCEDAGIDRIHVDVMDGHFVPNITIGPVIVEAVRRSTSLPVEAHLMIEHPWDYLDAFLSAGAQTIALHCECYGPRRAECALYGQYPKVVETVNADKLRQDLQRIRASGREAFVVLNPDTPLCLNGLYEDINGVVIMSVNPGFARQKFIPSVLPKIQQLREKFSGPIEVDGGVNTTTAPEAVKAGADILATASYFFSADDPHAAVQQLKKLKTLCPS